MQSSKGTKHARKLLTLQSVVCSQQRWQNSVLLVSARTDEEQCQTVCVCVWSILMDGFYTPA